MPDRLMSENAFGNSENRGLMNISYALLCDIWGMKRGRRRENVLLWVINQSSGVVRCCLDVGATDELWAWNALRSFPGRREEGLGRGAEQEVGYQKDRLDQT